MKIKLGAIAVILAMTSFTSLAASQFEGAWKVKDNQGNPFEITLSADGSALGNRPGVSMEGTWKDEGDVAVITWTTGWTTKITKEGDKYKKTAHKGGGEAVPAGDSEAEKIK